MYFYKEYNWIKEKKTWTDADTRFLLAFILDLQETQLEIAEQLKSALKELHSSQCRIDFYRNSTIKELVNP